VYLNLQVRDHETPTPAPEEIETNAKTEEKSSVFGNEHDKRLHLLV
jgi:hypothetical protein